MKIATCGGNKAEGFDDCFVVTSNQDAGEGTLRKALEEANALPARDVGRRKIAILFASDEKPTGTLKLGYFTIGLKQPLPNIYKHEIHINTIRPRGVTLLPHRALGEDDVEPMPLVPSPDDNPQLNPSGGLISVGDLNYLWGEKVSAAPPPKLVINHVNFVKTEAVGQKGENCAGGGFATGAGITFTAGDLLVRNAVFQDLRASAGVGGEASPGGYNYYERRNKNRNGEDGGASPFPSVPQRLNTLGQTFYDEKLRLAGGKGAIALNGPCTEITPDVSDINQKGVPGGSVQGKSLWGFGGSGGGGGAGGAGQPTEHECYVFEDGVKVCVCGDTLLYPGGLGGVGGAAGFGGGKSGTGQKGGDSNNKGTQPEGGFKGSRGKGSGAAIGVFNVKPELPQSKIALENVDFLTIHGSGEWENRGRVISSHSSEVDQKNYAEINIINSRVGGPGEKTNIDTSDLPPRFFMGENFITEPLKVPEDQRTAPVLQALSAPKNSKIADLPDRELIGSDLADIFVVNYEEGSSTLGVVADMTNPENPLNTMWRKIVPDRGSEIAAKLEAVKNGKLTDLLWTKDNSEQIGWGLFEEGLGAALSFAPGGVVAGPFAAFGAGLVKDMTNFSANQALIEKKLEADLKQNAEEQQELEAELKQGAYTPLATIDTTFDRSRVIIKDFEIGEDTIILPKPGGDNFDSLKIESINRGDVKGVRMKYEMKESSLAQNIFLEVQLSKRSQDQLSEANKQPQDYFEDELLSIPDKEIGIPDKNRNFMVFGSRENKPRRLINIPSTEPFGPASVDAFIKRETIAPDNPMALTTLHGDDNLLGSGGYDRLFSGEGNDVIYPFIGNYGGDTVNGQDGTDSVSYLPSQVDSPSQPVRLHSIAPINGIGQVEVMSLDPLAEMKESLLQNIEDFQVVGGSDVDLSLLPESRYVYSVSTGSGSSIVGTGHEDTFVISYYPNFNAEDENEVFEKLTIVDGGAGENALALDFEQAPDGISIEEPGPPGVHDVFLNGTKIIEAININQLNYNLTSYDDDVDLRSESRMSKEFDSFTYMSLGKGNDHYVGHAARQNVKGGPGADTISGGRSVDTLNGGAGNDRLISVGVGDFVDGGDGDDVLVSNGRRDVLDGGGGRDRYQLSSGSNIVFVDDGDDKIAGFQGGKDFLIFSDIGKANIEFVDNKSDRLEMMERRRVNIVVDGRFLFYRDTKSRDRLFHELKFNGLQGSLDSSNVLGMKDIAYSSLPSWFFSNPT